MLSKHPERGLNLVPWNARPWSRIHLSLRPCFNWLCRPTIASTQDLIPCTIISTVSSYFEIFVCITNIMSLWKWLIDHSINHQLSAVFISVNGCNQSATNGDTVLVTQSYRQMLVNPFILFSHLWLCLPHELAFVTIKIVPRVKTIINQDWKTTFVMISSSVKLSQSRLLYFRQQTEDEKSMWLLGSPSTDRWKEANIC